MKNLSLLRVLFFALAYAGFTMASTGQAPDPKAAADKAKQAAEIERQIQELQNQLKSLREPAPIQLTGGVKAIDDESLPAGASNLFSWRCIGPANMGGRVTALAVYENDPSCYWVATASGGLLKTTNNGSTFEHQFDREATVSIGAVAVAPTDRNIVWVGTGEANPRNSVSYGDGVYKSTDGGQKWTNVGLKKSYQIGRIVIHPKDPNVVYVGALGRLYGPNGDRGLFKTTDGGKSWESVLPTDSSTGVLDIIMHPTDPNVLIAATWERQRDEFDSFLGDAKAPPAADVYAPSKVHGQGTKIYKTTDGGKTWNVVTKGLPSAKMGRIGLDWHRKNPNLVFATIDTDKAGQGLPPSQAYLGVFSENTKHGVRVTSTAKDSPAEKAGLQKDDVLTKLNGKDLKTANQLSVELQPRKPGEKIKVVFTRQVDMKLVDREVEITLAQRPSPEAPPGVPRVSLGVEVEPGEDIGVVVTDVTEKGSAEKAGLKVGDVLLTIDDVKLDPTARFAMFKMLVGRNAGDKVKVTYQRGQEKKEVELVLEPRQMGTAGRPYGGRLAGQAANVQDQQGPDGVNTGGIFKSTDAGETWTRINSLNERPFYFSVVRSDPTDEMTIYSMGVSMWRSTDGGKTFETKGINTGVHSDQHELWINPKDGRHMIVGTDGGFYVSYDKAAHWEHLNHFALGQFYHVAVDNRRPYRVYGGLQDNGSWGIPSQTLRPSGPTNSDALYINGGDGFVCRVDPTNPDLVYAESQDGKLMRKDLRTGQTKTIRPKTMPGSRYRFNWNTPFILSNHNPHIYYAAGNYVFRSVKQGDDLRAISPEITRTKRGSATALSESPKASEVLWVGTDDGAVWLTRDGGKKWDNLTDKFKEAGLPGPRWVSTIEASRNKAGRCYVVFDAHRSDDDEPYVFATEDYGQTWRSLRANLPSGPTRVLREDLVNPNLLYLGTEFGAWASINKGESWFKLNGKTLPTVAVHEFAQPTTAPELVVGTHGRSVWVMNVQTLRQMTADAVAKDKNHLFAPGTVTRWQLDTTREGMFKTGTRMFAGQNPPRGTFIDFTLAKKAEKIDVKIVDIQGKTVRKLNIAPEENAAGFHHIAWDLSADVERTGGGFGFGGGRGGQGKGGGAFKGKGKGTGEQPATGTAKPPEGTPTAGTPAPKQQTKGSGQAGGQGGGQGRFGGQPAGPPVRPGVYRVVLTVDGEELNQMIVIEPDPNQRGGDVITDEAGEELEMLRLLKQASPVLVP